MICFKRLTWRNFIASGNQAESVQLDKAPTTLVLGKNGSGKCLRWNTEITVDVKDADVLEKLFLYLEKE